MNENKEKKIEKCKYSHIHFDGTTSCVEAGWEDDKVTKTDEVHCEACEKYKSKYIEYPITVNKIDVKPIEYDSWHCKTGDLVAVRPCGEKYEKKTYLGFYLAREVVVVFCASLFRVVFVDSPELDSSFPAPVYCVVEQLTFAHAPQYQPVVFCDEHL